MAPSRPSALALVPSLAPEEASVPSVTDAPADFASLGVPQVLCRTLAADGITAPFPIQAATMADALAGRDVLGKGRTGSGKTLAFVLPMLTRLAAGTSTRQPRRPRALILAPTRELASQIAATAEPLARALGLRVTTVFGGVSAAPQIRALRAGVDVVVACPGRLADHVEGGHARLDGIEVSVLDEADHMADLGFLPTVRRLLDLTPAGSQRLLFSATLDGDVDVLVRRYLRNPATHAVDPADETPIEMDHHVLHLDAAHRLPVLIELVDAPGRTIVFTRTKHRAKALTRQLVAAGVPAVELHGNLAQTARTRNMAAFSEGRATTMVATDIAARGIHVDDIRLVVHADPPVEHKAYTHRSGRTARAGAAGTVVTLMTDDQVSAVRDLVRKAGIRPTTTRLAPGHPLLGELRRGDAVASPDPLPATGRVRQEPGRSPRPQAVADRPEARSGAADGRTRTSTADGSSPNGRNGDQRRRRRRGGSGGGAAGNGGSGRPGGIAPAGATRPAGTGTTAAGATTGNRSGGPRPASAPRPAAGGRPDGSGRPRRRTR